MYKRERPCVIRKIARALTRRKEQNHGVLLRAATHRIRSAVAVEHSDDFYRFVLNNEVYEIRKSRNDGFSNGLSKNGKAHGQVKDRSKQLRDRLHKLVPQPGRSPLYHLAASSTSSSAAARMTRRRIIALAASPGFAPWLPPRKNRLGRFCGLQAVRSESPSVHPTTPLPPACLRCCPTNPEPAWLDPKAKVAVPLAILLRDSCQYYIRCRCSVNRELNDNSPYAVAS